MATRHEKIKYTNQLMPVNWILHSFNEGLQGSVIPHWHASLELSFTVSGEITDYRINDVSYQTHEGTILIINSGERHGPIKSEAPEVQAITLQYPYQVLSEMIPNYQQIQFINHLNSYPEKKIELAELQHILKDIYDLIIGDEKENRLLIISKAYEILYLINKNWSFPKEVESNQLINKEGLVKMEEIISYIQENYKANLNLSTIANYFHISTSYLAKLFKEYLGLSVMNYVKLVQVTQAEKLLRTNDYAIQEIAKMTGFTSTKSFRKAFINIYHIPPKKYQLSCQNRK